MRVSVVHATPSRQFTRELELPSGATVGEAIDRSGIAGAAGIDRSELESVGIFGRIVETTTVLRDGDRVEIYRPLKIDPKEARRRRASK